MFKSAPTLKTLSSSFLTFLSFRSRMPQIDRTQHPWIVHSGNAIRYLLPQTADRPFPVYGEALLFTKQFRLFLRDKPPGALEDLRSLVVEPSASVGCRLAADCLISQRFLQFTWFRVTQFTDSVCKPQRSTYRVLPHLGWRLIERPL